MSLAACNSSNDLTDSSGVEHASVDAAITSNDAAITTAATTAALTDTSGTVHTSVNAAINSNDAAITTAATTAALTDSGGTVHASVNDAISSNDAAITTAALTDSGGTVHASVNAAITSNDSAVTDAAVAAATSFTNLTDLVAAYNTAVAPAASQSLSLTTGNDVSNGGAGDDNFAATDTTYTANDVVVGGAGTDTLTITAAADQGVSAAASVSGIENVSVVVNSFNTETIDMANVVGAAVSVSNSQTGGATAVTVNNLSASSSLTVASSFTGTLTTSGSGTINAVDAATVTHSLTTDAASVTIVADDSTNTINLDAATAAAGTTTDKATITGAGTITLDPEATNDKVVDNLTLSGNGAAVTYDITDGSTVANTIETLTITGDQNVTVVVGADAIEAIATYTDSSTAGTTTVKLDAVGAGASVDLRKLTPDVLELAFDTNGDAITVTSGQVLNMTTAVTTGDVTFDINDGTSTDVTTGVITMDLDVALGKGIGMYVDRSNDIINTFNLINDKVAQTNLELILGGGTSGATLNITGDKDVALEALSTAKEITAGSFTGAFSTTLDGTNDITTITTGSGADTFTNGTAAPL